MSVSGVPSVKAVTFLGAAFTGSPEIVTIAGVSAITAITIAGANGNEVIFRDSTGTGTKLWAMDPGLYGQSSISFHAGINVPSDILVIEDDGTSITFVCISYIPTATSVTVARA